MRHWLALAVLIGCVFAASPGRAATVEVTVSNFAFDPAVVNIQPGDTVIWTLENGFHNVAADDGSFRSGSPGANFPFSKTFNSAGSFDYHCEVHPTMQGKVDVGGSGGNQNPGVLKLEGTAFNVPEGNSLTLQVLRLGGDDGAVSVSFVVSAESAQASDFIANSGTFSWADGDDSSRTLNVATVEDTAVEGNETVKVTLTNATGGATIDGTGKTATITIQDDDVSSTPPTAPGNLQAAPHSITEMMLSWSDSSGETGYRIEKKELAGDFEEIATAPANTTNGIVHGLDPGTFYTFRIRAENSAGFSPYSNEASDSTFAPIAPCVPSSTVLCLNGGRFEVEAFWRFDPAAPLAPAMAVPIPSAPASGLLYFFGSDNIEMLIKVLNACTPATGNKYWVFYAATTNVEFQLTVTDTMTGRRRYYFNPLNRPAPPVQDTAAFATCP